MNFTQNPSSKIIFTNRLLATDITRKTENFNKIIDRIKDSELELLAAIEFNLSQEQKIYSPK